MDAESEEIARLNAEGSASLLAALQKHHSPEALAAATPLPEQVDSSLPEPVAETPALPLKQILNEVAHKRGLIPMAIKSRGRQRALVLAREEFCYRAMVETPHSQPAIGKFLGDKDHSTIYYLCWSYCIRNNLPHPRGSEDQGNKIVRLKRARAAAAQKKLKQEEARQRNRAFCAECGAMYLANGHRRKFCSRKCQWENVFRLRDLPEEDASTEKNLISLGGLDCRWPTRHDGREQFFCGAPVLKDRPYCGPHCARAYM